MSMAEFGLRWSSPVLARLPACLAQSNESKCTGRRPASHPFNRPSFHLFDADYKTCKQPQLKQIVPSFILTSYESRRKTCSRSKPVCCRPRAHNMKTGADSGGSSALFVKNLRFDAICSQHVDRPTQLARSRNSWLTATSYNVTPEELFDLFGKFGPIRYVSWLASTNKSTLLP